MRQIETKMVAWIDEKLKGNGLAQKALKDKNPRALMIEAAKSCVGIRETGGNNSGPMVELIQETIGGHGREAWCLAFVQTCIGYAEKKTNIASPIFPTEGCLNCWEETDKVQRVKLMPLPGAICIWRHGSSWQGHTGIILGCDESKMQLVEGNTESGIAAGRVIRDGAGIYFTERSRSGDGDMKVVGWLKPF